MAADLVRWFDLKDKSGAKLKRAEINGVRHLIITGLPVIHPVTLRCQHILGFKPVGDKRYLVRRAEGFTLALLRTVFPNATVVEMPRSEYWIESATPGSADLKRLNIDLRGLKRLGRNANGELVYEGSAGRVIFDERGKRIAESTDSNHLDFLRLAPIGDHFPDDKNAKPNLLTLSDGFVRSMDAGEVQHSEDFAVFRDAIFGDEWDRILTQATAEQQPGDLIEDLKKKFFAQATEQLRTAIDAALLRYVSRKYEVAVDAYGPMARLYDYLPPYQGSARGDASMPQPLSIAAQRLLGDTKDKVVLYPQAYDGSGFAFLAEGTKIRACTSGQDFDVFRVDRSDVDWVGPYSPLHESGADALFFNVDPQPGHDEFRLALQAIRSLSVGARAILVLAADDPMHVGKLSRDSVRFLQTLARSYSIDGVFETAPILSRKSGSSKGLRVFAVRNVSADGDASAKQEQLVAAYIERGVPVLSSWDALKAHVTELMVGINEAQSQADLVERAAANEVYQRPYIAFSKLGEARTMSPSNLQASAQSYLTKLEQVYGPVDDFVSNELGMGLRTMEQRFSPEQIDAVAVMVSRFLIGRSSILADDTGIGKGRALAAVATWANKHGHDVFFVTDRANLFSDLARDLNDIGEWDRFRPLVFNADGEITVDDGPDGAPRVLATGVKPAVMADIMDQGRTMQEIQANIGFLTYSQISGKDSAKALWLKNQLANALVIFDEAHIAAGSDSNIALQVSEIAALARHVQFASATWAKTHDNLHIYQRALPASVTISTLTDTMRKGGDSFAEIFSTMLSAEGALIRREHDLSKLDVEMVIDEVNRARNESVSDLVADVLGAAAYISGDMQQVFMRRNAESVKRLKEARDVRGHSIKANMFSSSFGGGSVIYQIMKTVQGALNAEHVAELAIKSRAQGMKPVIVTDATGEALVGHLIEEMRQEVRRERIERGQPADVDDIEQLRMPTLRDALRLVVLKRLSMVRVEVVTPEDVITDDPPTQGNLDEDDVNGPQQQNVTEVAETVLVEGNQNAAEILVTAATDEIVDIETLLNQIDQSQGDDSDEDGARVIGVKRKRRQYREVNILEHEDMPQEAKDKYQLGLEELQAKIQAVPDIPIIGFDVIANRLTAAGIVVGEISGRKHQLRPVEDGSNQMRLVPRLTSKKAVKATIRAFNAGAIDAVVINRSAAAGVSMHASPRFADQSRRQLIEHQIPENPVDRVQLLGRVNRFDQLTSPLITTASTGIYGEVRYLMMQNRKLARMSANVRSSRDNAMALKGVTDLFNPVGRSAVKGFLLDNPLVARRLGITDLEIEQFPDLVNRLTMRIPLLTVAQQKMVYGDVYARFDEILMRAEMDGSNPLRPHELNVRAKAESEVVFFGDDTADAGMISAFDAPVIARKIKWIETLNPLRYENVLDASKISQERLVESGYLAMVPVRNRITDVEELHPKVDPELVNQLIDAYHGMVRLAHQTTGEDRLEDSVVKFPVVKRAWVKYQWMKNNLSKIVPGAKIGKNDRDQNANGLTMMLGAVVVTDVKPPENRNDYMDAGKWRITTVATGDERARTYTLRSLLTSVDGDVSIGGVTGDLNTILFGPYFAPGLFGVSQDTLRNLFEFAPSGRRTRTANVLTGNMYLAAEWSAAVNKGTAINYSDAGGQRHRVIQLPADMDRIDPQHLPVRLADSAMLQKFLLPLLAPIRDQEVAINADVPVEGGENDAQSGESLAERALNLHGAHLLDTSFRSAMAYASGALGSGAAKRDALLVIVPHAMVAMSCSPKDAKRIRAALASGQKAIRNAQLGEGARPAADPLNVEIRMHSSAKEIQKLPSAIASAMGGVTFARSGDLLGVDGAQSASVKESKASVITMKFSTQAQAERAIDLIRHHSGLEVYATRPEHKDLARNVIRETMVERREALSRMREETRAQIDQLAQQTGSSRDEVVEQESEPEEGQVSVEAAPMA